MYETEVKILDIDRGETERKLLSLGAGKTFDGEMQAVYYDLRDRSVSSSGGAFRLRREGDRSVVTFKKHIEGREAKVREEQEVTVSDFGKMKWILESAGFLPWLEMRKRRTTYELRGVHFEFDKYLDAYDYIPEFLEIEGKDIETIHSYAGMLGFRRQDCRPWDVVQVAQYYSGRTKA